MRKNIYLIWCRRIFLFVIFLTVFNPVQGNEKFSQEDLDIGLKGIVLKGESAEFELTIHDIKHPKIIASGDTIYLDVNGKMVRVPITNGKGYFNFKVEKGTPIQIQVDDFEYEEQISPLPGWISLIPPLIAIILALVLKEVIISLLIGILFGSIVINVFQYGSLGILKGFFALIDYYIIDALNDWQHLSVIIFSSLIGGIVAIISRNGGMKGVVHKISLKAKNAKSGQMATYLLGIGIFFDDYANTLVVGNTMRGITDKLRISREKLAYIVDSTAAPIASIAFVTTWIGAELGYIDQGIKDINVKSEIAGVSGISEGVYSIFFNSLQYSFYPLLTLAFILMLILKNKDFGPMFKAEKRARLTGDVSGEADKTTDDTTFNNEMKAFKPDEKTKPKSFNAIIPILVVITGTFIGLIYTGNQGTWENWELLLYDNPTTGFGKKLSMIIGHADSYTSLLWASFFGLFTAITLTVGQKIMTIHQTVEATLSGFKTMMSAVLILVLAWSLANVTEEMHTAEYITRILGKEFSPIFIPTITFIFAAFVAFSTGSSWGTMAILYPLILPATWAICMESDYDYHSFMNIFYNTVSCVLAGSVLGDHCSPISDTTILSSLASSCNHVEHVRTQLPYALTVGIVGVVFGTFPAAIGMPFYLTLPICIMVLYLIISYFGRDVPENAV